MAESITQNQSNRSVKHQSLEFWKVLPILVTLIVLVILFINLFVVVETAYAWIP
jgi:hypothetical protein